MISRTDALTALQREQFDVVVIGGGITGAGVALDAATRGFSVALVERDDCSCGTSSRSSKMVHGGLRYLQNFDLGLVREALVERQLMVRLAPHLVKPLPVPGAGARGRAAGPAHRGGAEHVRRDVAAQPARAPPGASARLRSREASTGAPTATARSTRPRSSSWSRRSRRATPPPRYLFYDCQTDDSRLVLTVLGEAERFGAVCVNGARAVELIEEQGKAAGVVCEEAESGERFAIAAANVVNATGVWADRIRPRSCTARRTRTCR